jgi:hypothetical protein
MQHRAIGRAAAFEPCLTDVDRSSRESIESGDRAQDRRLAGSRRSPQRNQISASGVESESRHEGAPAALDRHIMDC